MLEVRDLVVEFREGRGVQRAGDGAGVGVERGEIVALLGPSACGKTAMLRAIAGLEAPAARTIALDGQVLWSAADRPGVPAERRDLAMVFQTDAAGPRGSVADNVAAALGGKRLGKAALRDAVMQALAKVGLGQLAERAAQRLSAGERQRVALARAIARDAKLLLLDEPLANLDAPARAELRGELRGLGKTALCATHDQEEALALSGRVALMRAGRILECGTPMDLYLRPQHAFTARFLGDAVLIEGRRVKGTGEGVLVETDIGNFVAAGGAHDGAGGYLMIRPEFVEMVGREVNAANLVDGIVRSATFAGKFVDYVVQAGRRRLRVQRPATRLYTEGEPVRLRLPAERCAFLPKDD
jgi:iron(III) transport system ATP-binding protein